MILDEHRVQHLGRWWSAHGDAVLKAAVAVMSIAAAVFLAYEFWRLLFQGPPLGAIDLGHRHRAVQGWFAGTPVYTNRTVLDPPATNILLWPFLGWMGFTAARWTWALTSVMAVAWTTWLVSRYSGAASPLERTVAALLPASIYATGATIGNGQLAVHLLPLLMAACVRLLERKGGVSGDVLTAALFVGALVKPNLAAPFFWILLFVPGTIRPALFACAGYAALTIAAASFQDADLLSVIRQTLAHATAMGLRPVPGNVANLHVWFGLIGLERFVLPATVAILVALGAWVYAHRRADLWLLLGVTGYVSLLSSYHRWYDEVLILLPMVALFRIAKGSRDRVASTTAAVLLALTMASMLAPGGLFLFPRPWNLVYVALQVVIWLAGLVFLVLHASRMREPYAERFDSRVPVTPMSIAV